MDHRVGLDSLEKRTSHALVWYTVPFPHVSILQPSHCNSHILPPYEPLDICTVLFLVHCVAHNAFMSTDVFQC